MALCCVDSNSTQLDLRPVRFRLPKGLISLKLEVNHERWTFSAEVALTLMAAAIDIGAATDPI